jgi:hypothetical protein
MSESNAPGLGEMILYDRIEPPLLDNTYRLTVKTDVTIEGEKQDLDGKQAFFNIEGPRFALSATEVAGVFPPRNGHGPFQDSLPHIALYRRTLPWERQLDPANRIGSPTPGPLDLPELEDVPPWLALLLFEEGEYKLLQSQSLSDIMPPEVIEHLDLPEGVTCEAVETNFSLLASIIPSKEELQLLAHVRQVHIADRELSARDSGGFFAVVMSNRLPRPGAKCRACLVSLEGRFDIVPKDPPSRVSVIEPFIGLAANPATMPGGVTAKAGSLASGSVGPDGTIGGSDVDRSAQFSPTVRLVCLHSWQFACIGPGNFRDLMQGLDIGMIGKVENPGHPALLDSGHLQIDLQDRLGVPEKVWYRSPLGPFQLTRDPLGPYHSADQARRVTPETGGEDVSYAAAFEVGRLLAAADPTLAQELMRWRRTAYQQSSRADALVRVQQALQLSTPFDLHLPLTPLIAVRSIEKIAAGAGPIADPFGLNAISGVIGLNPTAVMQAFNLPSERDAVAILGGDAGGLGAVVNAPAQTSRSDGTLDGLAADTASLDRLKQSRDRLLENAQTKLGEPL